MPRWTQQTKQQQRERIQKQKPWLQATGPRSDYGRSVSSKNAAKKHRRRQSSDVTFVSHLNQQSNSDRPLQVGDRVKYVGGYQPTMLACGDSLLKVVGFCEMGTGAIACRTSAGQLIWIYPQDLQQCPDGQMKPESGSQS
jgi:hypothetical protein